MPSKYVPLHPPADLGLASLICAASLASVISVRRLHVSYYGKQRALEIGIPEFEIVVDPELAEREWYIVTAVGSNPL